ncbi:MAG TPA: MBL fold metallo-hydrolase [Baekduia sp.]|nr:MBL fold metallo-hydrolase [Baekduia sp.]
MRIHALTTGRVRVKHAFLHASTGVRRQVDLFLPGPWSDPLPIHCWAVEHDGRLLLVDTGELASARDIPFARFEVGPQDELPRALAAAGLAVDDVDRVVLTHLHGDHMHGAVHVPRPVLVHDRELTFSGKISTRVLARVFRQPVPAELDVQPLRLDAGRFGGFECSAPITGDGRIVAVATPGHTPGHLSVVCIDDEGRHVLLAGDLTDTLEQLHDRRPDAVGVPRLARATFEAVFAHAREHPTVYLPSHDPESAARLAAGTVLA